MQLWSKKDRNHLFKRILKTYPNGQNDMNQDWGGVFNSKYLEKRK